MFRVLGDIPPVFLVAYRIFGLVGQFGHIAGDKSRNGQTAELD